MSEDRRRKRRVIHRHRSRRSAKLFLLTIGWTGLALGAALLVCAWATGNRRLLALGLLYVFAAIGLLSVRQALASYGRLQRRYGQDAANEDAPETPNAESAPRPAS